MAAAGCVGTAVLWLAVHAGGSAPQPAVRAAPAAPAASPWFSPTLGVRPPAADGAGHGAPLAVAGELPSPSVACAHQQLRLQFDAVPLPAAEAAAVSREAVACVGTTAVLQSGDLRRYVVAPEGTSRWTLDIATGDARVLAASLSAPDAGRFACAGSACTGFMIGPRDRHGARSVHIDKAPLVAQGAPRVAGTDRPQRLNLSARIIVAGDEQQAQLACADGGITVVERDAGVYTLCASAGASVARLDDGRSVFGLRSQAGDTLLVGVGAEGLVDQVELGALGCSGAVACAGATVQPGADGGTTFSFSGTTLSGGRERVGPRSATLNGSAAVSAM